MRQYRRQKIKTDRLEVAYYHEGKGNPNKLLLLHGNLSSSAFLLPLFPFLEKEYEVIAPDLRCFGETQSLSVDAKRGYRDWSDDIDSFCRAIGWDSFYLGGWSMGGNIAIQYTTDHPEQVKKLILIAPGSPYGFGGSIDEKGTPHTPVGLGSGGGTANPGLANAAARGSRLIMRDILRKFYFKADFRMSREWENLFIDEIAKIKMGNQYYPGNYTMSPKWPYVIAGDQGVLNAMSPRYGNQSDFLDVKPQPEILWIHGTEDIIVSDTSLMELGYLGKCGMFPGWPGDRVYPPQPMVSQIRYFLNEYRKRGGLFVEFMIPGGHMCALESPFEFLSALRTFIG